MLNGTAVNEALTLGKELNGPDCDSVYKSCPLDREQSMAVLSKLLPNNGQ